MRQADYFHAGEEHSSTSQSSDRSAAYEKAVDITGVARAYRVYRARAESCALMARRAPPRTPPARAARRTGTHLESVLHQHVQFRKTVGESDVYLFAGITGDLHPNHVDEVYMNRTPYAHRIVHGALLIGFMSTTSTLMAQRIQAAIPHVVVSYGYDRIRFVRPVHIGDTITVDYTIAQVDAGEGKTFAEVTIKNQRNELVCAGTHIMKLVGARNAPTPR
jgi:acyl dehydratase